MCGLEARMLEAQCDGTDARNDNGNEHAEGTNETNNVKHLRSTYYYLPPFFSTFHSLKIPSKLL